MSRDLLVLVMVRYRGPPARKLVLATLAEFANRDGIAWPSRATVAECCSLDARHVQRHLNALAVLGVIEAVSSRKGGRAKSVRWRLNAARIRALSGGTGVHVDGGTGVHVQADQKGAPASRQGGHRCHGTGAPASTEPVLNLPMNPHAGADASTSASASATPPPVEREAGQDRPSRAEAAALMEQLRATLRRRRTGTDDEEAP